MKAIKQWMPILAFVAFLFVLTTAGILTKEKTYSVIEKRELQTRPEVTKKGLKDGSFQKTYESYLSDQFPGRDRWVQLQTSVSRLFGKSEANGVYFGADHYLLEKYTEEDFEEERLQMNMDALASFVKMTAEKYPVHVMLVPTKTWVLKEKLPLFAPTYDEDVFYQRLEERLGFDAAQVLVPVERVLKEHADEEIYYRTDHHWTTLGAWYGYEAYRQACKENVSTDKKQELRTIYEDFYGTTYAKVNQASQADVIAIYEPKSSLQVIYNMGEKTTDSLYEMEYLDTADQYRVFTGGNQAVLEISGGEKNGKTLLLIKDSFANCMIPFLAEDYEKMVVVDLRQLNVDCDVLVEMFQPTEIFVLYNSAQFAKDRDIAMKFN